MNIGIKQPATPTTDDTPVIGAIYESIAEVKREINATGVGKGRTNTQQNYKYRGIDDALDGFSGPFARNSILVTPVYTTTTRDEIQTRNSKMFRVVVEGVFTFLSLKDGSYITVGPFEAEGVDVLDKATSKAQSISMRNMLFLTFTVPFMGEEDPDGDKQASDYVGDAGGEVLDSEKGGTDEVIDVSESQRKLLDVKLKKAGKDDEWLLGTFGGVSRANINAAIKHIDSQSPR